MNRTTKQNRSLHLAFRHIADELNSAGLDMRRTLKPEIDIAWNDYTVKEYLFRPLMTAQTGKKSTTELETKEVSEVFDTITRHLAQKFGIKIDFPSEESKYLSSISERDQNV